MLMSFLRVWPFGRFTCNHILIWVMVLVEEGYERNAGEWAGEAIEQRTHRTTKGRKKKQKKKHTQQIGSESREGWGGGGGAQS